jgi:hypothetical protein
MIKDYPRKKGVESPLGASDNSDEQEAPACKTTLPNRGLIDLYSQSRLVNF